MAMAICINSRLCVWPHSPRLECIISIEQLLSLSHILNVTTNKYASQFLLQPPFSYGEEIVENLILILTGTLQDTQSLI